MLEVLRQAFYFAVASIRRRTSSHPDTLYTTSKAYEMVKLEEVEDEAFLADQPGPGDEDAWDTDSGKPPLPPARK